MVALFAAAALPFYAFYSGHPFRIRYMVPMIAVEAIGAGLAAGVWPGRRARAIAAAPGLGSGHGPLNHFARGRSVTKERTSD